LSIVEDKSDCRPAKVAARRGDSGGTSEPERGNFQFVSKSTKNYKGKSFIASQNFGGDLAYFIRSIRLTSSSKATIAYGLRRAFTPIFHCINGGRGGLN